ncbi:MAG: hypothetical protein KGI06_00980 [Candidatus Micrarchaeota archaeon]|nr:hypothetical protein [Candidatus Micrarchaeota archaeon]
MPMPIGGKSQIALEFIIVYSFVLIVFILIFSVIASQRAASINQQEYSLLQLQSQNIASYIDQAVQAGSGYSATVPLVGGFARDTYTLSISSTGVVIVGTTAGTQQINAYGFSQAKSLIVNGTAKTSANGISIYSVPTFKGFIRISNLNGIIYIDVPSPAVSYLPGIGTFSEQAKVRAAEFNDSLAQERYVSINGSGALATGNSLSVYFWFYANQYRDGCGTIFGKPDSSLLSIGLAGLCSSGYYPNDTLDFNYYSGGIGHSVPTTSFPSGSWINAAATFNGASGELDWYINGAKVASETGLPQLPYDSNIIRIGNGDLEFNGLIANLQVYNSVLTQAQVGKLYYEGIGGSPSAGIVGWWPLDGNPNDYSGYGNHGSAVNGIKYDYVVQLSAEVHALSGNALSNALVGFAGSASSPNGTIVHSAAYTGSDGKAYGFITANIYGNLSAVADVFNGNITTSGNLIGWWPLDFGYKSSVPDFGKSGDSGSFNGAWMKSPSMVNFAAASFPGDGQGIGGNQIYDGFVTVNSARLNSGITGNNTFTLVSWIYYKGPTPGHNQGIFGDWPGSGGGFQLIGYCITCTGNAVLYIGGNYVRFPNGMQSFPKDTWEMVTAEYNGNTGYANVYLNGTLLATAILPKNLNLAQSGQYYIGNDASQPAGIDTFNGLVTNVQLYDSYLTQGQINSTYSSGISAPPVPGGLVGWWPLLGSAADYSYNMDSGAANYNVTYVNSAYNTSRTGASFATFNGASNVIIPYSQNLAEASNAFSISLWFLSFNGSFSSFNSALINSEAPNGYAFDMNICGNNSCGLTGLHGEIGTGSAWLSTNVDYPFSFNRNQWYNIVETFNSTGWSIYMNGNIASHGAYSGMPALLGSGDPLYIGSGAYSKGFAGQIADVQVYNAVLTRQQAMQIYGQGLPEQHRFNISVG